MDWIDFGKIAYLILNGAASAFAKKIYMLRQESKEK